MSVSSLKKNVIINSVRILSNLLIPLVTFPYISRVIMPENLGKVNFATSIVAYFIILASLGIPYYGIREATKVRNDRDKLTKITQELLILNLVFSFISYLVLIVLVLFVPRLNAEKELLLIMSSSILLTTIGIEWLYQALEKYAYITIRSLIFKVIYVILVFCFINNEDDYILYAIFITIATVGSNFLNLLNSRKYILYKPLKNYDFKRHLRPILVMMSMNIAISIYINLDVVMLGFLATDFAVGIYAVSVNLAKMALALVSSVGSILLARVTYYLQENDNVGLIKVVSKATDFIFFSALPIIIVLAVFSDEVVYAISGKAYMDAAVTLKILLPIILALAFSNLIGIQILIPLGKEKLTLYSVIVGAVVSFASSLFFIPRLAEIGAAISTVIAEISVTIVQFYFAWGLMKKVLLTYNKLKYMLSAMLLILILVIIKPYSIENLYLNLLFVGTLSVIVYVIPLVVLKEKIVLEIISLLKTPFKTKK